MSTDIRSTETHSTGTDTVTDDETHTAHEVSDKQYILIALFLAVLTAMEVAVTEIAGMPEVLLVPSLLIMMVVKFFVVVSYFMHLKHDSAIFKFSFYIGVAGAVVLFAAMLSTFHFFNG